MRLSPAVLLLACALPAQVYAPPLANTTPQNARNNYPFQRNSARVQNFVDGSELSGNAFLMADLAYRWDEATTSTTNIQTYATFDLEVGTTTRAYTDFGGDFAANRVGSTVAGSFSATTYSYALAGNPPSTVWGGADGKLRFPLGAPALIVVPANGCFFFDIKAVGRTGTLGNALVDFNQAEATSVVSGTALSLGAGCSSGAATATLLSAGQYTPGSSISFYGSGRAPGQPRVRVISGAQQNPALPLPGTTTCFLHVDVLTSPYLLIPGVEPVTGSSSAYGDGTFLGVPPSIPNSTVLFVQDVGITTGLTLYSTNARQVNMGQRILPTTANTKGWFCGHHLSATAEGAAYVFWGVYAMCMN